ncbi:MAG: autotransporter, partial [Spirochaetaceae bacterium]|nr:autotransporter [Spirochaetaceae bacterium]
GIKYDGNFMNLKLGVDVAGLIDNTTLSVIWATENILNELSDNAGNINKLGTLNFKAKIAL